MKTTDSKAGERTQHTPGPWKNLGPIQGRIPPQYELRLAGKFEYGTTDGPPYVTIKGARAEANARLIAAAPELLEALKYALSVLNMSVANEKTYDGKPLSYALADCATDAEAAIAKAEGNQ